MSALYKKILVPLDGSELATQALPQAEAIARSSGAQLILLRVIERHVKVGMVPGMGNYGMGGGVGGGAIGVMNASEDTLTHRHALDEAEAALTALLPSLHHHQFQAVTEILTGDPAAQIIDYANAKQVDLIVMSTHGRTGIERWRFGSVANQVLQEATCTVVIVRPAVV